MASHDTLHTSVHGTDDALPSYEDINTPVVVMVGVISALLTLLSMMFFQGLFYHWEDHVMHGPDASKAHVNETIEKQKSILAGGENHKSIDEAMQTIVSKYKK